MRKILVLLVLASAISFPRIYHNRDLNNLPTSRINRPLISIRGNCPECVDLPEATCGRMLPPKR